MESGTLATSQFDSLFGPTQSQVQLLVEGLRKGSSGLVSQADFLWAAVRALSSEVNWGPEGGAFRDNGTVVLSDQGRAVTLTKEPKSLSLSWTEPEKVSLSASWTGLGNVTVDFLSASGLEGWVLSPDGTCQTDQEYEEFSRRKLEESRPIPNSKVRSSLSAAPDAKHGFELWLKDFSQLLPGAALAYKTASKVLKNNKAEAADSCRECDANMPEGANFCAKCGTPREAPPVICPCTREFQSGERFCAHCGKPRP